MQYLIVEYYKRSHKWIADTVVSDRTKQKSAINFYVKARSKKNCELWIFPVNHSTFYKVKNGKLYSKRSYYEKEIVY